MHARFRSPLTARFLSTDPVGGEPQRPQSWNRYAYVRGNPLKFLDPDGRDVVYADDYARDAVTSTREISPGTDAVLRDFEGDSARTLTFETADIQDTGRGLRLGQTATDRQGIGPEERPRRFIVQLDRAAIELKGADSRSVVIHETVGHVLPNSQKPLGTLKNDPKSVAARERQAQRRTEKELRRIDKKHRPRRLEEVKP